MIGYRYSYATRLLNGKGMLAAIKQMDGYDPPRIQESPDGFQAHLDLITNTNKDETNQLRDYSFIVEERKNVFFANRDSVNSTLLFIKDAVISQYGKKSQEAKILKSILRRMRWKQKSVNSTESTEQENVEQTVIVINVPSRYSEKTFASMTKNFSDFVTAVTGFVAYKPGNDALSIESLTAYLDRINSLNSSVADKEFQLRNIKHTRKLQYDELKDRGERIKYYVKSKFGADSKEYLQINNIKL